MRVLEVLKPQKIISYLNNLLLNKIIILENHSLHPKTFFQTQCKTCQVQHRCLATARLSTRDQGCNFGRFWNRARAEMHTQKLQSPNQWWHWTNIFKVSTWLSTHSSYVWKWIAVEGQNQRNFTFTSVIMEASLCLKETQQPLHLSKTQWGC